MPEEYFVDCPCGASLSVELFKAGSTITCDRCRSEVKVPNSIQLKLMNGDKYPHLGLLEKIKATAEAGERPFQGECHACLHSRADMRIPVLIADLKERVIDEPEHPVMPVITPWMIGVRLKKGKIVEESWARVTVPVLLCNHCWDDYQRSFRWRKLWKSLTLAGSLGCMIGIPIAFWPTTVEPVFSIGLGLMAAAILYFALTPKADGHPIFTILRKIRWVGDCLRSSMDFRLSVGNPERFTPPESTK